MGKLHSLRRAIRKNPNRWVRKSDLTGKIFYIMGARKIGSTGKWAPVFGPPYTNFVRKTLLELAKEIKESQSGVGLPD